MSFFSFLIFIDLLSILFHTNEAIVCPSSYYGILNGCYKINTGMKMSWSNARENCLNEMNTIVTNKTGYRTHLVALESGFESRSLIYWMKGMEIHSEFWTDGVASSSSWIWSNQPVIWDININDQKIYGNGSNYRLVYNIVQNTYQVDDANDNTLSHSICEYQDRCDSTNSCQNNATCYLNVGRELCICVPGYTGITCDQQIDECLSSPCQHGGACSDALNNYTCDCSNIFFHGSNCEIPNNDPTKNQRSAAFWSVFGVLCGLVILLTLSDIPWNEIAGIIRCPWYQFKCCSNGDDEDEDINRNHFRLPESSINENKNIALGTSSKGVNYHVMNTVWDPDQLPSHTPSNPQYDGYQSPDQRTTPNNVLIQSFGAIVLAKQKAKEIEGKRVYAVDIVQSNDEETKGKTPADTMVSWTQQLQEQLKNKQTRPTSASSSKELIQSEVTNANE